MLYGLGFIFTVHDRRTDRAVPLARWAPTSHLHDTYFVVAHFHYVMVGGTLWAFLGGLFHWWPKLTGKMFDDKIGQVGSVVSLIGFNTIFFPQFILGTRGMPRRYFEYLEEFTFLHRVSTIGAYILLIGLATCLFCLIKSIFAGKKAPDNPWGAASLEWQTATPPIAHKLPRAADRARPVRGRRVRVRPRHRGVPDATRRSPPRDPSTRSRRTDQRKRGSTT